MSILTTTTPNTEGKRSVRYLGLVTGEASAELQLVSEKPVTSFADTYHKAIPAVRDNPLQGAEQVGANANVGARIDYIIHGSGRGMLMVSVSGTAVVSEDL